MVSPHQLLPSAEDQAFDNKLLGAFYIQTIILSKWPLHVCEIETHIDLAFRQESFLYILTLEPNLPQPPWWSPNFLFSHTTLVVHVSHNPTLCTQQKLQTIFRAICWELTTIFRQRDRDWDQLAVLAWGISHRRERLDIFLDN